MAPRQTLLTKSEQQAGSVTVARRSLETGRGKRDDADAVVERIAARAAVDIEFRHMLDLIVDVPARPEGEALVHAARAVNGARRRAMVDDFLANSLTTEAARQVLGAPRAQNLHTARQRGRLIGHTFGNITYFPAWQFEGGTIRSDLARILEALGRYAEDAVTADRVMRLPREDLDGRSIIDALDDSDLAPTAWVVLADSSH